MSLILDALRKAEAERQRGAAPGLQNVAAPPPLRPGARRRGGALGAALALGLLVVGALVAWRMLPAPPSPPVVAAAPAATAQPAVPTPAVTATAPVPTPPAPLPLVVSAPPTAPVATEPTPPSPTRPQAAPAAPVAPILTQVRRLADLPPEQRRELPPLAVGGSVWSEQASARFVVLDGQVLREGDAAAPGLVLVKLAPRSATLRWRDTLIEVPF